MPSLLDLPDELLVQVIEDAVPTAMGSGDEYKERCRTLHAVSLTSKRLHSLTLPLLYRVLRASQTRFRSTRSAREAAEGPTGALARTLVCVDLYELDADLLSFAVAAAPRVSDLRIYYCEGLALVELQPLSALTSLTLHAAFYNTALDFGHVQSLCLPHVFDLSLDRLYFTQSGCEAFLSSATFPSLKHLTLGVVMLWEADVEVKEHIVPLISPTLLRQLGTLRCWHTSHPSDFPFPDALRVLHNVSVGSLQPEQPSYASLSESPHVALLLRGMVFPDPGASGDPYRIVNAKGALREMAATLSRVTDVKSHPLKLAVVDSDLLEDDDGLAELKPAMDAFLEACKTARVEVIVQETPQHGFDSLVSKSFVRWCEKKYATE
ncbi:hypothetical protein JCM10213_005938 [Rhodosporidiobolus nylandii]